MIAKILPTKGKAFAGVINYSEKKVDKGKGELLYYQGFISQSRESIINMLEFYSSGQRSKKSSPIFHASINFPLNEQLDDDTLVNIAKDYMAGMGYAEQPFVVFRHDDTKHRHVHIVSTRVDVKTGKRISDKFERVRSQSVSAKIEREYGLQRVERYKGKGYQAQQENLVDVLDKKFQEIFASYAPKNLKELNALLGEGFEAKHVLVEDKKTGKKVIKGTMIHFSQTDEDGQENEIVIPSSAVPFLKEQALMDRLAECKKKARESRGLVKDAVYSAIRLSEGSVLKMKAILEKQNMQVFFSENSGGIYGWGIKYTNEEGLEIKYKGTELSRNLSWNGLRIRMENAKPRPEQVQFTAPAINRGFASNQVYDDDEDWKKKLIKKKKKRS